MNGSEPPFDKLWDGFDPTAKPWEADVSESDLTSDAPAGCIPSIWSFWQRWRVRDEPVYTIDGCLGYGWWLLKEVNRHRTVLVLGTLAAVGSAIGFFVIATGGDGGQSTTAPAGAQGIVPPASVPPLAGSPSPETNTTGGVTAETEVPPGQASAVVPVTSPSPPPPKESPPPPKESPPPPPKESPPPQESPPPPKESPPPPPSPSPASAILSGARAVIVAVIENVGHHPNDVPPTCNMNILIERDPAKNPQPVYATVSGCGLPTMTGTSVIGPTFGPQGGTLEVSAKGTYRGYVTTFVDDFTISPMTITGTITIGGDGALPTGNPLVLSFTGGGPH